MNIIIRDFAVENIFLITSLIKEVFFEHIAPLYPRQGVDEFFVYIDPRHTLNRQRGSHAILEAVDEDTKSIIGMIETRNKNHVCLFFVKSAYQRKGVGRLLLQEAIKRVPLQSSITVNASPNAVDAYEALGFYATGELKEESGMRFVPMRYER